MAEQAIAVTPHEKINIYIDRFPWVNNGSPEISATVVTLDNETSFVYGSLVGLNGSIRKLADQVASPDSEGLQKTLFQALPSILSRNPHSGVSRVEGSRHIDATLFIASRNLAKLPSLVSAVETQPAYAEWPVVLKVGTCKVTDQTRLLGLLGVNAVRNRRRRST